VSEGTYDFVVDFRDDTSGVLGMLVQPA